VDSRPPALSSGNQRDHRSSAVSFCFAFQFTQLPNYPFTQFSSITNQKGLFHPYPMPTRDTTATGIMTPKMLAFVAAWHGSAIDAARAAGYKNPKASAEQLMNNPVITNAIEKQQDRVLQETAKRFAEEITFGRADIFNHLWEIAKPTSKAPDGPSYETQLKASQVLAELFDAAIGRTTELARLLQGKTDKEIEHFCINGNFPGEKNG
jgi:hypothetical protein